MERLIRFLPITTLVLLFLYLCGGLYLIGFWSIYDLDLLGLVSFVEIPKSFILPFAFSAGTVIVWNLILFLIHQSRKEKNKEIPPIPDKAISFIFNKAERNIFFHIDFWVIVISLSTVVLSYIIPRSMIFWPLSCLTLVFLLTVKTLSIASFRQKIMKDNFILNLFVLSILVPFLSFALGKIHGIGVYKNMRVKSINILMSNSNKEMLAINDSITLKLVGFLGDHLIASDLNNKKLYIFKEDEVRVMELEDIKKSQLPKN